MPVRIAVVTNAKDAPMQKYDTHAKEQAETTSTAVVSALRGLGYEVTVIEAGPELLYDLKQSSVDAIFNIATGYRSKREQANIAAILEFSGIPFTGSSLDAHVIGLHKHLAKMVMETAGIRTPKFYAVHDENGLPGVERLSRLRFPVIVKPAAEGSSVGISVNSVTDDPRKALQLARDLIKEFGPPALIEEFIWGREFTVGVLGYPDPKALPVEEIIFKEDGMYTFGVKSKDNVLTQCPARIPEELAKEISDVAERAARAIGCRDLARVDIRVSSEGLPYVLEINTLPGLMPSYSEFPRIAEKAGISYEELTQVILDGALRRRDNKA